MSRVSCVSLLSLGVTKTFYKFEVADHPIEHFYTDTRFLELFGRAVVVVTKNFFARKLAKIYSSQRFIIIYNYLFYSFQLFFDQKYSKWRIIPFSPQQSAMMQIDFDTFDNADRLNGLQRPKEYVNFFHWRPF